GDQNPDAVDCLLPGRCERLPGATSGLAAGVQAFVLGPPHDRGRLVRINPSTRHPETFEKKKGDPPGLGINWGWTASAMSDAVAGLAVSEEGVNTDFRRSQPFDVKWGIPFAEARDNPFFRDYYFATA